MAENESLDIRDRHSGRWRRLLKGIERNDPVERIAVDAVWCLHKTFKNLVVLLPVERLLEAATDEDRTIREVVRECRKGREYAELFAQQTAIHTDPVQIVEGVAYATVDRFLDQIELKVVGHGHWPDMSRYRTMRENVMMLIRNDVANLARRVADCPNEKPRMPRRSADQIEQDQRDLLNLSLQPC